MAKSKIKTLFLDLFFPKFCFGCQREGSYLCQDCRATLEISDVHQKYETKYLSDLYHPCNYQKLLIKKLIQNFKYEPFIKELAKPLSSLIIDHFQLIEERRNFSEFVLIPIPLEKRKLKWRGFNQAEELSKELSKLLNIPVSNNVLVKIKETQPQVELGDRERRGNIKGVFSIRNGNLIDNKNVLLIDDVYTTGSTMEEAARVLREAGAKEIIGIVIARANPGEDKLDLK